MFAGLKAFSKVSLGVLCLTLASCQTGFDGFGQGIGSGASSGAPAVFRGQLPAAKGEIIGNGPVRVTLLVPKTAAGGAAKVAAEMVNSAKLALNDIGLDRIQLVIKDTAGQTTVTASATAEALAERSSLILGPLLSANVQAAAAIARPAGVPIVAFSTTSSVAQPGVYLNSFPPEVTTNRVLSYAALQGKRKIVAILPNDAYGLAVEAGMQATAFQRGIEVLQVAKYNPVGDAGATVQSIHDAVKSVAEQSKIADAIFVPYFPSYSNAVVTAFINNSISILGKPILGAGDWLAESSHAALEGGWFAQYDQTNYATFKQRYTAQFGVEPGLNAGLAYDAVSLSVGLASQGQQVPYANARFENVNGFTGVTGLFRFNNRGLPERGLSIYQYSATGPKLINPAPADFTSVF